ncbi:MAG: DUF4249 family protein [Calditrichaeota bacterium]|nr:DUF4249 family protein [Calditrichota bacterium]
MKLKIFYLMFAALLLSCGDAVINLDKETYSPKIVIDGYVLPHHKVDNIRISRNFPLNEKINIMDFPLKDANVSITDLNAGKNYPLTFNFGQLGFEYRKSDLEIKEGNSYRLSVSAEIDGKKLTASSTTTVPLDGFHIDRNVSQLDPLKYREKDENGDLRFFTISFKHSASTDFYALSIVAQEASMETFIEDNMFGLEKKELDEDFLNRLKYEASWAQTSRSSDGITTIKILWLDTWFYGQYRAILYAGDNNFKQYFLTHNNVQDIDGNLYEPKFFIDGDGIGVFGSALADTVHFNVLSE